MNVELHVPKVIVDGPVAFHDQACAVCWYEKAVYNIGRTVFEPCWKCQANGWRIENRKRWRSRDSQSTSREGDE